MAQSVIKFGCPRCSSKLTTVEAMRGTKLTCPNCQGQVKVPGNAGTSADKPAAAQHAISSVRAICPQCGSENFIARDKAHDSVICSECLERFEPAIPDDPLRGGVASTAAPSTAASRGEGSATPAAFSNPEQAEVALKPADDAVALAKPSEKIAADVAGGSETAATGVENPSAATAPGSEVADDEISLEAPTERPRGEVDDWISGVPKGPPAAPTPVADTPVGSDELAALPAQVPAYCPVCGTMVYAANTKIGQSVPCPDCYSEIPVRRPKANSKGRPAQQNPLPAGNISLKPAEANVISPLTAMKSAAEAVLSQAEVEQDEREQKDQLNRKGRQRFSGLAHLFAFLQHPTALLWLLGFSLGAFLQTQLLRLAATYSEGFAGVGGMMFAIAGMVLGAFWGIAAGSAWVAIVQETSAGKKYIDEWATILFVDWISEAWLIVYSAALAIGPGLLFLLVDISNPFCWGAAATIFVCIFPIALFSLMDNESIIMAISPTVFQSLAVCFLPWLITWGVSLLLAGLVLLCFKGLVQSSNLGIHTLCVVAANLIALIYFRILGMMAWKMQESMASEE